jgi:hypothetical protein
MDNEIVIVGKNMMGQKWLKKICLKNNFHEQC